MKTQQDLLGHFEQLVMAAVLSLNDDAYGVSVHEKVNELAGRPARQGAIYITLDRLEQKGLLSSKFTAPSHERGGRRKRCYILTRAGRNALGESADTAKRIYESVEESWRFGKWRPIRG